MSHAQDDDIAIIGMAGCYAGAPDLRTYWRNILGKVDAAVAADDEWTGPYLDENSEENDRIYTNKGGFLGDLVEFDPIEFGIMPTTVDGSAPDMYLALKLARDALSDAGYGPDYRPYDGRRTGVILGCGAYFNRGEATLLQHGVAMDQALALVRRVRPDFSDADIAELRAEMKSQLPKFNTEMAPGLVPNVASGIIANRLDLMGPNYLVDAACASSLLAVEQSIRELRTGNIDMMLTGGVMAENSPQVYMLFSELGALSRGDARPFAANAGGTLLGEGAGLMLLKRVDAARRDGDRIHAVIKGVGASSDGRAKGLLAPRLEGEILALERAYQNAGVDPTSVGLIEAHGTGIPLGDATEVQALTKVFGGRRGDQPDIALGSVKSMICHCLPAAGSASMIKTAMALSSGVLPPTLCDEVNPDLGIEHSPFYINNETRPWVHGGDTPRRAGVNAFGFGGINCHVVLEADNPPRPVQVPVLHAPAGGELIVLAAASAAALSERATALATRVRAQPRVDLGGLGKALAERIDADAAEHRLAIVAGDGDDLATKLDKAIERIQSKGKAFKTRSGIHYGMGAPGGRTAFLFPGEGSQYAGMLADLAIAFPQVREWFDLLETASADTRDYRPRDVLFAPPTSVDAAARERSEKHLYDMDLASESVSMASQGLFTLLSATGVRPDVMLGHSTGENSALVASGYLQGASRAELATISHAFNQVYQKLDAAGEIASGTLLTIGAMPAKRRDELLADFGDELVVAMDNCPNQAVLFGAPDDVSAAREILAPEGAICSELPFGRAYHTRWFEPVADAFRQFYETLDFKRGDIDLISCATGEIFPDDAPGIRDLACAQWARPVRFRQTLEQLYDDGYRLFVEVGPSASLTAFVNDTLRERGMRDGTPIRAISTNSRRQSDTTHFFASVAELFASGVAMQPAALYANRDVPVVDVEAAPADKARPTPRLKLAIPPLAPGPQWQAPALPQAQAVAFDAHDTPAAPAERDETPSAPARPMPAATFAAHDPGTAAVDPREAAMQTHFELMNAFLDSQSRVMGLGGQGQPVAPALDANQAAPQPSEPSAAAPLLGEIVSRDADQLVAEHSIRLDRDCYLQDHCLGDAGSYLDPSLSGLPVVPFTFCMEILAEAARALGGDQRIVVAMENVTGRRWLGLPLGQTDIRVHAQIDPQDRNRVHASIENLTPGQAQTGAPTFQASVLLADTYPPAPEARGWPGTDARQAAVSPPSELYTQGMFHGPRLQGVQQITRWSEQALEAQIAVLPRDGYLADNAAPQFTFDAALLDAAGQTVGYWLAEMVGWRRNCFPYYIARVTFHAPPDDPPGRQVLCRSEIIDSDGYTIVANIQVLDSDGQVLAEIEALTDRDLEVPECLREFHTHPAANFLGQPVAAPGDAAVQARQVDVLAEEFSVGGGLWQDTLAQTTLNANERIQFHGLPTTGPRRGDWLAGRIAAKEAVRDWVAQAQNLALGAADVEIVVDNAGKPFATCPLRPDLAMPEISLSHSRRRALAVAGAREQRLGVDMQWLDGIDADDVASGAFTDDERHLLAGASAALEPRSVVAGWCAKEAAAKADGAGLGGQPQQWRLTALTWQDAQALADIEHQGRVFAVHVSANAEVVYALCAITSDTPEMTAQA